MDKKKTKEFVEKEKILAAGLMMAAVIAILVLVGFNFAPSKGHLRYVLYQSIVYPLVVGVGMVCLGYSIHHKYHKIGNLLMGIGSVIGILMFSVLTSLGGWLLFVVFCSLISELPAFLLTTAVFAGVVFLFTKSVEKIVRKFLEYSFTTRRQLVLAWTIIFILPLVLVGVN